MTTEIVLFILIQGLLFSAALMDIFTHEIYDFVWLILIPVCVALIFTRGGYSVETLSGLAFYCLVQERLMVRVYGRADCHALSSCAFSLAAYGAGLEAYVFHLAVTFILLCSVQFFECNIDRRFRLKREIPMIPYILVGFWIVLANVI